MTALSWIFGGKKKDEKPIPVTVEAIEVGSDEDYAIIQANSSRPGLYPRVPPSPYSAVPPAQPYTPLPYSVLPRHDLVDNNVRTSVQNQLEGVPFVLASVLERSSSQNHLAGIEVLRRAVFQIAADINDPFFDYNFKLEHTALQEATMYNDN